MVEQTYCPLVDLGHNVDVTDETGDLYLFMSQYLVQFADISDIATVSSQSLSCSVTFFLPTFHVEADTAELFLKKHFYSLLCNFFSYGDE